jgi:hypothetical protein
MVAEPKPKPDGIMKADPPPAPPPTPEAALVDKVAALTDLVAETQRESAEAIARLNRGLEAFGRVGNAVDRLTDALEANQRFVREQQVLIRRRQRDAAAEYVAHVTEGMTPGTPPAGEPED